MRMVTLMLVALLSTRPMTGTALAQRAMSAAEERDAWSAAARGIPPGVTVTVELSSGRRITGTLMSVTEEGLLIKERARNPRPALMIPLADVARIERQTKNGGSIGKAIAAGAAAGVGGFLTFLAVALMISD